MTGMSVWWREENIKENPPMAGFQDLYMLDTYMFPKHLQHRCVT